MNVDWAALLGWLPLIAAALPLLYGLFHLLGRVGVRTEPSSPPTAARRASSRPARPVRPTSKVRPVRLAASRPAVPSPLADRITQLVEQAGVAAREARVSRATVGFTATLDEFLVRQAQLLRDELLAGRLPAPTARKALAGLELVLAQVQRFIEQRQDPDLLPRLGDADTLALTCYQPIIDFARSRGLGLTSARPAVELGDRDLSTWTGFIPTGLAPIYLPPDFFTRVAWWPALAHEIAHDFLAAVPELDGRLRSQLGLPDPATGARPLNVTEGGLALTELVRVYGGWFEELFCDIFGTLMLGPAYLHTMVELFALPGQPEAMAWVQVDARGRGYDPHPPRLLRVLLCARVVELENQGRHAEEALSRWRAIHQGLPDSFYYPVAGGQVAIPTEPVVRIGRLLVEQLCTAQLQALDGFQLRSVPGVDYGPALTAAVDRAVSQLLAHQVPTVREVRALVAGAVLAARTHPERQAELLVLARRAIMAFGTTETRLDAYSQQPGPAPAQSAGPGVTLPWQDRFLLSVVLGPRGGRRPMGGSGRGIPAAEET